MQDYRCAIQTLDELRAVVICTSSQEKRNKLILQDTHLALNRAQRIVSSLLAAEELEQDSGKEDLESICCGVRRLCNQLAMLQEKCRP